MNPLKIAGFSLTLTGALLLQGCGGGGSSGSNGVASSVSTSSASSVASSVSSVAASNSSSSASSVSIAEAQLGAENLSPDSGITAVNTLATEDLSPENTQLSAVLATGDLTPF